MSSALYVMVTILDLAVICLFYGPNLIGVSLRWIPGFEDIFPVGAFLLLWISIGLVLTVASGEIRNGLLQKTATKLAIATICIYSALAGLIFASLLIGGA